MVQIMVQNQRHNEQKPSYGTNLNNKLVGFILRQIFFREVEAFQNIENRQKYRAPGRGWGSNDLVTCQTQCNIRTSKPWPQTIFKI